MAMSHLDTEAWGTEGPHWLIWSLNASKTKLSPRKSSLVSPLFYYIRMLLPHKHLKCSVS